MGRRDEDSLKALAVLKQVLFVFIQVAVIAFQDSPLR